MRTLLFLLVGATLLTAALATEVILYGRNIPAAHAEWLFQKCYLSDGTHMGWELFFTRNLLAGNQLRMGEWHGFQEVLWAEPANPDRLELSLRVGPQSYLSCLLRKNDRGSAGVRLSRWDTLPSLVFQADARGRLVSQRALPLRLDERWHRLVLQEGAKGWSLSLDGLAPLELGPLAAPESDWPGTFGFRGGYQQVELDDIRAEQHGVTICREDFRNGRHFRSLFLQLAALLLVVQILPIRRGHLPRLILLQLVASSLLASWYEFDIAFYSRRYTTAGFRPGSRGHYQEVPVETVRRRLVSLFSGFDVRLSERRMVREHLFPPQVPLDYRLYAYSDDPRLETALRDTEEAMRALRRRAEGKKRILLIGTSQTFGVGYVHRSEKLAARLAAEWKAAGRTGFVLLNAAQPGSNSSELRERLVDHLAHFQPDLTVFNLGCNDADPAVLRANLEVMTALLRIQGGTSLLVLEAWTAERLETMAPRHRAMRQLAETQNIPICDLNAFMQEQERQDKGFLWTDAVHATGYGQSLMAAFLAGEIETQTGLWKEAP